MVYTRTNGINNTHGIDWDSWYRIGTPESHTYERAECYQQYAEFFLEYLVVFSLYLVKTKNKYNKKKIK